MNKVLIKDKTSFMELVLSFFILLILILGIIFLKIKITANNLDLELIKTDLRKADYEVIVGIYFLGFIKISSIKFSNGIVRFLFFTANINEIMKSDIYLKAIKPKIDSISKEKMIGFLANMKLKLEDLNLSLKFGTDDVIITSILIAILSGIITTTMQLYIEKFNKEKYKWKILPDFEEKLFVDLNASLKLSYSPILSRILKNV